MLENYDFSTEGIEYIYIYIVNILLIQFILSQSFHVFPVSL